MTLSELISKYDFHDSMIVKIEHFHKECKLSVSVELCNWRQSSYEDNEPELILGDLVFYGVNNYKVYPECSVFNSNDIIDVNISHVENYNDFEVLKFILLSSNDVITEIIIQANEVRWFYH